MSNDRSIAELESDFAAVARAAPGAGSRATALTTLFHIGDEYVVVLSGPGDQPEAVRRLDLGAARIARDCFHHDPPTSREIERAIDLAENEIMRLGRPADATTTLFSTDRALREWALLSGPTMAIDTVEQWFQRLASASFGNPGALQGLPPGRRAAATLLVLREFMHHQGHAHIVVTEAPDAMG